MIFYLEIIFSKSENSSRLIFLKRDRLYEITQIIIIRQNCNKMMIVFKIIFSLLKCCNNKQEFLIMCLIFDLSENYFFWIKNDRMLLCLFYVDHKRYKLRQNCCNDKLWCIDFYFNEISEVKMNQHKHFRKRFDESSKRLPRDLWKDEWFILSFLFIFFKQFR